MPNNKCLNCGNEYYWEWEDAFDKFGFDDGDGQVETYMVEEVLINHGYEVECHQMGLHNVVIFSIKKDGKELMPDDSSKYTIGYGCPREYLPNEIIALLDEEFNDE